MKHKKIKDEIHILQCKLKNENYNSEQMDFISAQYTALEEFVDSRFKLINEYLKPKKYKKPKKYEKINLITPNTPFTINDLIPLNPDVNENTLRAYASKNVSKGIYNFVKKQNKGVGKRSCNMYITAKSTDVKQLLAESYKTKPQSAKYITYD